MRYPGDAVLLKPRALTGKRVYHMEREFMRLSEKVLGGGTTTLARNPWVT